MEDRRVSEVRDADGADLRLSHIDENGRPRMVDVGDKDETKRTAVARGSVYMKRATLDMILSGGVSKGDVLSVAQTAGIMAAKNTAQAIPMCHNIFLSGVEMRFTADAEHSAIHIEAEARTTGKTGVEMEALHAVSVAALTVYDMCKAVDRGMRITDIRLHRKEGGKSGIYEEE
jgi:cyclic pyranopterin phosphate synthase